MSRCIVGYDLDKPNQDYPHLNRKLKTYAGWWHCLDSTWLIQTGKSCTAVRDELLTLMDSSSKLLVIDVSGATRAWTGFNKECSDWLRGWSTRVFVTGDIELFNLA
jgi:hypothetical protein